MRRGIQWVSAELIALVLKLGKQTQVVILLFKLEI